MIKNIGILTGGKSAEREISFKSCEAIENACNELGYNSRRIIVNGNIQNNLSELAGVDFVFLALHGGDGENGIVQGLLDSLNIPYNGSGVLASALGMEKSLTKQLVKSFGILTPGWNVFNSKVEAVKYIPLQFPQVIKPSADGSTIGLSIINNLEELPNAVNLADKYDGSILFEEYIDGRELTVTIVGQKAYPIVEIVPSHKLYDYECKYEKGMSEYICPAKIPNDISEKIKNISLNIYNILQCSGYARADFILDSDNNSWFLEINTLPGMTETSLVPKAAKVAGISFNQLIQMIIYEALKK